MSASTSTSPGSSAAPRSGALSAYRALAHVLPVLVLIQAWMAGSSNVLFGSLDIVTHGMVGNGTFLLALIVLALALVSRAGGPAVVVAGVLVLLMFAQIGLGYIGRDTATAAAWHIPNGVLIFGLATYQITLSRVVGGGRRGSAALGSAATQR